MLEFLHMQWHVILNYAAALFFSFVVDMTSENGEEQKLLKMSTLNFDNTFRMMHLKSLIMSLVLCI